MLKVNNTNHKVYFGSFKQFKRMFHVCAYSGQQFTQEDRKSLEHIVPKIRGGKKELSNLIVVKRSVNGLRSNMPLGVFMDKHPEVLENILSTIESLKGKIIDGVNWAEEVKKALFKETGKDIFK